VVKTCICCHKIFDIKNAKYCPECAEMSKNLSLKVHQAIRNFRRSGNILSITELKFDMIFWGTLNTYRPDLAVKLQNIEKEFPKVKKIKAPITLRPIIKMDNSSVNVFDMMINTILKPFKILYNMIFNVFC
jgi:hypothetical protein